MKRSHSTLTFLTWLTRVVFLVVFGWNILCAFQFITQPNVYVSAYQLSGPAGEAAIQGLGIAFLMWNVTYPFFIIHPRKMLSVGWIILIQQLIGLIGESFIIFTLPDSGYALLLQSIMRFIAFDAAGLILMSISFFIFKRYLRGISQQAA